jgi:hypothetical protein
MKIKITIEYDAEAPEGLSPDEVAAYELRCWLDGNVAFVDLDDTEFKFEVVA